MCLDGKFCLFCEALKFSIFTLTSSLKVVYTPLIYMYRNPCKNRSKVSKVVITSVIMTWKFLLKNCVLTETGLNEEFSNIWSVKGTLDARKPVERDCKAKEAAIIIRNKCKLKCVLNFSIPHGSQNCRSRSQMLKICSSLECMLQSSSVFPRFTQILWHFGRGHKKLVTM